MKMAVNSERLRRWAAKSGYAVLSSAKDILHFRKSKLTPFFGFARKGMTTAAFMKARKLADLFQNSPLTNDILYVCSGNIPLKYCLKEKRRGVKLIINQNGVYYPAWYDQDYVAANEKNLAGHYRAADYIIFQSHFSEESSRRFIGAPICPHEVLYNPVDTSIFTPNLERTFNPSAPTFLATGNFYSIVTANRLRLLLEAFEFVHRDLPLSRLIVAGQISPHLLKLWLFHSEAVSYIGSYHYKDAPSIYQQGDVYLSTQFNDTCPSAVLEAMSCGLPVVHLFCGGTPELVGEAGVGVPVEKSWEQAFYPSPERFAAAMIETLKRRDSLSSLARKRCTELFDIQLWKQRHEEVFKRVID